MSSGRAFGFSCDSGDGCLAHAAVEASTVDEARRVLGEVLGWDVAGPGDLCATHHGEQDRAAARIDR